MLGAWRHVRYMSTPNNALSRRVRDQKFRELVAPAQGAYLTTYLRQTCARSCDQTCIRLQTKTARRSEPLRSESVGSRYARNPSMMAVPIPATIINVSAADITPTLNSMRSAPLMPAPVVGELAAGLTPPSARCRLGPALFG